MKKTLLFPILVVFSLILVSMPTTDGYGGGGGGGGGSGSTNSDKVCGDRLCSEIPGGRVAFEKETIPTETKTIYQPPGKQVAQGIPPEEIICKEGLELIIKNNRSPACVRLDTAVKLEDRGWGVMSPTCCKTMPDDAIQPIEEFSLVYTKEGGIAGIRESIVISSSEKTMIKTTSRGVEEISLDDTQLGLLLDTINENDLLYKGREVYFVDEGWADYFTYTLHIVSGDAKSDFIWTDTNDVPDLVLISRQIEELG